MIEKTGRYITAINEQPPLIMCETHAQVFESMMIANAIPHTIYEFDDEDESKHCHACDLVVAKEYARRVEEQNQPKIIIPGEYH